MKSSRTTQFLAAGYANNYGSAIQRNIRDVVQPVFSRKAASTIELLDLLAGAASPQQLNKLVNRFQGRIWNLSRDEQALLHERLAEVLSELVLRSKTRALRLEAAGWMRLLVQAAYLSEPDSVFITLVVAATRNEEIDVAECRAYLNMIVDCFWPFRHPYATYNWEKLPANAAFSPLAALFALNEDSIEDLLVAVFSQLPTLDNSEIAAGLLPVVLRWAKHPDPDRRQRVISLLARLDAADARAALEELKFDNDPAVRLEALRAVEWHLSK